MNKTVMPQEYLVFECPNPLCRMRFPGDLSASGMPCPRCSTPVEPSSGHHAPTIVQHTAQTLQGVEIHVILDNLRSAFNVGSILRTADGAGCTRAYLCGISATPENPKVAKTGLSAEHAIAWSYHPNGLELARALKADGIRLWALEGGERAVPITNQLPVAPGGPLALVSGNEVAGVDPEILALCEKVVYLPMVGFKRSLNVAVATGIALYLLRYMGSA